MPSAFSAASRPASWCKTAVLSHPWGQPAQFNPRFLDFAHHYGFEVRACGVRQAHEKGRASMKIRKKEWWHPRRAAWRQEETHVSGQADTSRLVLAPSKAKH